MTWNAESSGQEAFDAVLAFMKAGPMKGVDFRQCPGFQHWTRYLKRHPQATLGACLTEFETRMRSGSNAAWPMILMQALGDQANADIRARIVATASGDAALNVLGTVKLADDERDALHAKRHLGKVRLGKVASPDARKPGRPR